MRTPLVVVTGVDPTALDTAMLSLSWDLPQVVTSRHRIDPGTQVLTRVVSDATGVVEHAEIPLEHACVGCALREDVLPTLERLARDGRWRTVVACLPTGAEADQLTHVLASDTRLARHLRLSGVVAALPGADLRHTLLGDDLLRERGWHTGPGDGRGVGEVACAQVERADLVVLDGPAGPEGTDLVRALARPGATLVEGAEQLDGPTVAALRHDPARTRAWCSALREQDPPSLGAGSAWRLDLSSHRALHPGRLVEHIDRLGGGPHRSRGCFWLPTRPGLVQQWDGAGGQLSIGHHSAWGLTTPRTRLLLTGLGPVPTGLVAAFEDLLLTPAEARLHQQWRVAEDGFEPWLGAIHGVGDRDTA